MNLNKKILILEILAVILTGVGKFIFMDWLNWRLPYIIAALVFWIVYIFRKRIVDREAFDSWGLSLQNFSKTFLEILPFATVIVALFVVLGRYLETSVLDITIIPILIIYPIWGIIQQFIMIGVLGNGLKKIEKPKLSKAVISVLIAVIFAIVHFPSIMLVIGTFFLAFLYSMLYLNGRNLIVMGIYHGWLGAIFFYTLLGRNAWVEVFGNW